MKKFLGKLTVNPSSERSDESRSPLGSLNPFARSSQLSWRSAQDDEPPAYSPVDPASPSAALANSNAAQVPITRVRTHLKKYSNDDDPFAFLTFFDTVFVIDDSGSMSGTPWAEVAAVLRAITSICTSHDLDGIDLYFLNHKSGTAAPSGKAANGYYNITTPEDITRIFDAIRPHGFTPTGTRLGSILQPYVKSLPRLEDTARDITAVKPINIIVITDGDPSDEPEEFIKRYARRLDDLDAPSHQVGIQFFQVGRQPEAKAALKRLDDALGPESGVRDMVDTVSWDANPKNRTGTLSADTVLKVVLGAVMRRLDKMPTVKKMS